MISDLLFGSCQFSSLVFHDCRYRAKTKTELSKRNTMSNDFELVLLRQTCQRNHVLNYASRNGLGTM